MSITVQLRTIVAFAGGLAAAAIAILAFQAMTADAVGSTESTFVPITPCRLFDTRPTSTVGTRNAPIGQDTSAIFQVTGTNGDCTIPAAATAVSINLTGAIPTAQTNLRMYPANAAVPNAAVLNMSAGQPPLPNKLDVKLSPSGAVAIYNRFGSIHVIGDVMGYYRNDGVADLEARIAELETLTASMSNVTVDGHPAVRFTGVNVQVVNGSGGTGAAINGTGNLIVGYNEKGASDLRTGSHNLVVGTRQSYSSFGGFLAGSFNTVSAPYASVSGGTGNVASGEDSSVSGGRASTASGEAASVTGGFDNTASGPRASVLGGNFNDAKAIYSAVLGGGSNTASGDYATVAGGNGNTAAGEYAAVSGGSNNTANSQLETVGGGDDLFCSSGGNNVMCAEGFVNAAD